jgi:hypothetical protein
MILGMGDYKDMTLILNRNTTHKFKSFKKKNKITRAMLEIKLKQLITTGETSIFTESLDRFRGMCFANDIKFEVIDIGGHDLLITTAIYDYGTDTEYDEYY